MRKRKKNIYKKNKWIIEIVFSFSHICLTILFMYKMFSVFIFINPFVPHLNLKFSLFLRLILYYLWSFCALSVTFFLSFSCSLFVCMCLSLVLLICRSDDVSFVTFYQLVLSLFSLLNHLHSFKRSVYVYMWVFLCVCKYVCALIGSALHFNSHSWTDLRSQHLPSAYRDIDVQHCWNYLVHEGWN